MILVTGATGFVGSHLLPQLHRKGFPIRILLPPEENAATIPKNIPVEVAICGLSDEHNLKAALKSVTTVIHLATDENRGLKADLQNVDIDGTDSLLSVAAQTGVKQFIFISYLGASAASAYPLLRAKGKVEQLIINSSIKHTILRTGPVFGQNDHFVKKIKRYQRTLPFVAFLPDKGKAVLHPLWVEDLVTAVLRSIDNPLTQDKTIEIGGPEFFSLHELFSLIRPGKGFFHSQLYLPSSTLRLMLLFWQVIVKNTPITSFDLDTVAADRTAPIDTISKLFSILPLSLRDYLTGNEQNT
jgi:NADH dehydrogenase